MEPAFYLLQEPGGCVWLCCKLCWPTSFSLVCCGHSAWFDSRFLCLLWEMFPCGLGCTASLACQHLLNVAPELSSLNVKPLTNQTPRCARDQVPSDSKCMLPCQNAYAVNWLVCAEAVPACQCTMPLVPQEVRGMGHWTNAQLQLKRLTC